jgi:conjugal transfer pilus assembly protein TraD
MDFQYSIPLRKNYETYAIIGWLLSIPLGWIIQQTNNLPDTPFIIMICIALFMATSHVSGAYKTWRSINNLKGREVTFYDSKEIKKIMSKNPNQIWYGKGFLWSQPHAQFVYEILKRDTRKLLPQSKGKGVGSYWIHGLEDKKNEINLTQSLDKASLMTLIIGTTGSGKTRFFETLITQAVLREEACIVIDPKGDKEMKETCRNACNLAGHPDRFTFFHPAFANESVRIDPLYNFNQPTEIASRISAVIPDGSDSGPFKSFGFMAINNIVQGLLFSGEHPSLIKIRRYLEGGPDILVIKAVQAYCNHTYDDWEEMARQYIKNDTDITKRARGLSRLYTEKVQAEHPNSDLEGLLTMFNHDREHFGKMIASTLPILNMLTSGDIGSLLSPDEKTNDDRQIIDTTRIINHRDVLYMGIDSLSNNMVGSAIGSIFLADLASVSGARYNYGVDNQPVNIFVDEAAECLNDQMIQLLNKGRGSRLHIYLATQTINDFAAKLGDENKAQQVLGNLNNLIALRTINNDTQEFITKNLPMTRVEYLMRTQGNNTDSGSLTAHGGNVGERLMEEEAELFAPQLLGMLPDLEYIGKLAGGKIIKGRIPILKNN